MILFMKGRGKRQVLGLLKWFKFNFLSSLGKLANEEQGVVIASKKSKVDLWSLLVIHIVGCAKAVGASTELTRRNGRKVSIGGAEVKGATPRRDYGGQ